VVRGPRETVEKETADQHLHHLQRDGKRKLILIKQ
jgi:hypothetical protein